MLISQIKSIIWLLNVGIVQHVTVFDFVNIVKYHEYT